MLGYHQFHSDEFQKHERSMTESDNPFIDPTEWHRFLKEMKDGFAEFLTYTPKQVDEMFAETHLKEYYGDLYKGETV